MQQPAQHLLPVELLPRPVFLHHHVRNLVNALVRRKALVAALAFAPPPDRVGLFTFSGIYNTVLRKPAVRTPHRTNFTKRNINIAISLILSARFAAALRQD
jgi:hypothetical protein